VIENAVEQLAERAQRKGLQLLCWFDPEIPTALQGDPVRIKQILTNLVGNAIKFTQQGDIVVRVSLDPTRSHENGTVPVWLRISDTGMGITPEGQARLFQSFSQVDNSSTRVHGGTGLGLAICKQLSELMGGSIGVESEIGKGSTFWVRLTLPRQTGLAPRESSLLDRLKGARVCAAVADPRTSQMVEQYLGSWGVQPMIGSTGTEALTLLMDAVASDDAPVIALIDETVPDMEQSELLEAIQTDACLTKLPVLRLVSFIHRVDTEQDAKFGTIPFVTKPIRYDTLRDALRAALEGSQPGQIPASETARSRPTEASPLLSGLVLLAEDNPVNQEVAVLMLESLGCSVDVVSTGQQVIEASQRATYDVILMDCQMPEMNGFTATGLIREREERDALRVTRDEKNESSATGHASPVTRHISHIPIIALTAHATPGDREQCLAAGMDDYFTKPFTQEKLREVLGKWLKERPATASTQQAPPSAPVRRSESPVSPIPVSAKAFGTEAGAAAINRKAWDAITVLQRPGQPDALAKILSLYLSDSQQLVDKLKKAVQEGEAKLVNEAAHSLKSRSAALGALSLAELCKQLEKLGRTGDLAGAPQLVAQLESEFAVACEVFSEELQKRAA
jgi:CheY-like chemotaxis protein/HPt (histidine-containing phosphotransfer) domain-containing protein